MTAFTLRTACFPNDYAVVVDIFTEYVKSPKESLLYQNYEAEFAALPGEYESPDGTILLAWQDNTVVACSAFRRVDESSCELKRVYVRPAVRGMKIGAAMLTLLMAQAKQMGYSRMCLDVLPEFQTAQKLYQSFGFVAATPVSYNPVPGTSFLACELS